MEDIKHLATKTLTGADILKLVNDKANIMNYREFQKYDDIYDAMGPHKALILLYETKRNFGHWTLVFEDNNGNIQHFDSYGYQPDKEQGFVPKEYKKNHYNKIPHLVRLLYESGQPIHYSQYKLQSPKKEISTCGRWVALRLLLRNLDEDKFKKIMTTPKGINPDYLVTMITEPFL